MLSKQALLYLAGGNGSFASSPYLDAHGEVHNKRNGLKYLHRPRYEAARRQWLSHSIPTLVARKIDAVADAGGWEGL